MGIDALNNVLFGTFLTVVVLILLVVVVRGVKRRLFPSDYEGEGSEAMTELLLLQAELQRRASVVSGQEEEDGGADSDETGPERGTEPGGEPWPS